MVPSVIRFRGAAQEKASIVQGAIDARIVSRTKSVRK